MRRTDIYLDEEQAAHLNVLAAAEGISRAELIRRLVDRALAGGDRTVSTDLAAIEGSFGVLRDADAPAGGPGDRERHRASCR